MEETPRHLFLPEDLRARAVENRALPIAHGQTISQPLVVAAMTEALALTAEAKVLEIGTGSGYQTAILASLARQVFTVEFDRRLSAEAERVLTSLGHRNITFHVGDGFSGWPEEAPFDGIIVTAAPARIPLPLMDQLKLGGRLVIPVGPADSSQELLLVNRETTGFSERTLMPVRFVPFRRAGEANPPPE
jgi:protein-L-isoaspartate(D-aspartate) O-methyltransferase